MARKNKAPKLPDGVLETELCSLLSGSPSRSFRTNIGAFPHKLVVVQPRSGGAPIILLVVDNAAKVIDRDATAALLCEYLSFCAGDMAAYHCTFRRCGAAVERWSFQCQNLPELPKPVAFKSDPELCMTRLPFDPMPISDHEALLAVAPMFAQMIERVSNRDAFCMRLGSIFDHTADRKQAVWMSGPQDAGKSVFAWLLQVLSGQSYGILNNTELKTPYWRAQLVGKRIGIVNEAAARFIRSDEFKAITGDEEHPINQKNQPVFIAKLPVLLFFFSNDPPEIPHDDALILRIIDCRIGAIGDEKLTQAAVREKLLSELPFISGYCLSLYQQLQAGGRIPCDRNTLAETIDKYEATYLDFIESHYVEDHEGYILRKDFYEMMINSGIKDGRDQAKCKRVLFARYRCAEKRHSFDTYGDEKVPFSSIKRVFVIKGIRERNEAEKQFGKKLKLINH